MKTKGWGGEGESLGLGLSMEGKAQTKSILWVKRNLSIPI